MNKSLRGRLSIAAISVAAAASFEASGALAVYEGFDYTAGSALLGQNGGTGFANAWGAAGTVAGATTIQAPGMSYDNLVTSGNGLFINASSATTQIFRDLSALRGADGTTTWVSLMHIRTGPEGGTSGVGGVPSYVRPVNFALFEGGTERWALGEGTRNTGDQDLFGLVVGGSVDNVGTRWSTSPIEVENFALVRIDHGAANVDTAYLWVNPSLASEPDILTADATTTANFTFNRIRPFAGGVAGANPAAEGLLDEFRVGDTFLDVAPIPEPSTIALLGVGAIAFAFGFRRRK